MKKEISDKGKNNLKYDERILLFLYDQDILLGRDIDVIDDYSDLKEFIYLASPSFIHSKDLIMLSIVQWYELREANYDRMSPLPSIYEGLAYINQSVLIKFYKSLKRLLDNNYIIAFTNGLRALRGFGGKNSPLPQVWSVNNRNKPKDIVAISLTEAGFKKGKEISVRCKSEMPWQTHIKIATDKEFGEKIIERRKKFNNYKKKDI